MQQQETRSLLARLEEDDHGLIISDWAELCSELPEYAEPQLPLEPLPVASRKARVDAMSGRYGRKQHGDGPGDYALRHPEDADSPLDRFGDETELTEGNFRPKSAGAKAMGVG